MVNDLLLSGGEDCSYRVSQNHTIVPKYNNRWDQILVYKRPLNWGQSGVIITNKNTCIWCTVGYVRVYSEVRS